MKKSIWVESSLICKRKLSTCKYTDKDWHRKQIVCMYICMKLAKGGNANNVVPIRERNSNLLNCISIRWDFGPRVHSGWYCTLHPDLLEGRIERKRKNVVFTECVHYMLNRGKRPFEGVRMTSINYNNRVVAENLEAMHSSMGDVKRVGTFKY